METSLSSQASSVSNISSEGVLCSSKKIIFYLKKYIYFSLEKELQMTRLPVVDLEGQKHDWKAGPNVKEQQFFLRALK